jgi:hypothetical protein
MFENIVLERIKDKLSSSKFDDLIREYHYLKKPRKHGRQLKYFIVQNDEIIGGIQFSDPVWTVYRNFDGYSNGEIVENSRFLLLKRIKNLASHVLMKSIKMVNVDWKIKTGVIPRMIISYVDIEKGFLGTIYKASNFELFGMSFGKKLNKWGKNKSTSKKLVFVYKIYANRHIELDGGPVSLKASRQVVLNSN